MDVEVLATGLHKGVPITRDDLDELVANQAALAAHIKAPVKLGHSGAQLLAGQKDGDPALGWVSGMRRVGDKLVATLSDVPATLRDLIAKKRYRRVSAELALDFAKAPWEANLQTGVTGKVLTGLALLGADLPAVANLADLGTLLATETGGTFTIETADRVPDGDGDVGATATITLHEELFPRTIEDVLTDVPRKDGNMPDDTQTQSAERIAELEAQLATRDAKDAERDGQVAELTAQMTALKTKADAAEHRAAIATALQREADAARFVEQYSSPTCLKLTNETQCAAIRTLYLHLASTEAPLVVAEDAVTLKLSDTPTALSGIDVLTMFVQAIPDAKVLLTQLGTPSAGVGTDGDEYAHLMATVAKENSLNLSVPADVQRAAQLVGPMIRDRRELAYAIQ